MLNLVSQIFEYFDYKHIGCEGFHLFKSGLIKDYWLIFEGTPSELLKKDVQGKLISKCRELDSDPALDKNTNVICLWSVSSIDKNTIRQIHKVEEDIFFFKKHVLYYTENELNSFLSQCSTTALSDLITKEPTNPSVFNNYKTTTSTGTWEALLYRICIKLTFIPIAKGNAEQISSLYENHNDSLSKKPKILKTLERSVLQLTDSELDSVPDELLTLLKNKMDTEG